MNTQFLNSKIREEARVEATRHLLELRADNSQPIDIFQIIQDAGIWLMFQPLKNLYGAYIPQQSSVGIIINSGHPLSLQRFTAAHEYAHYVLQHPLSLDDEGILQRAGNSSDPREVAADAFAANLLMPLHLVNRMLGRMGLSSRPSQLTDIQAYQLSLDLGVSYAAAVNQLVFLKKIDSELGEQLRKPPRAIKLQIARAPLENPRADIWPLDLTYAGRKLNLRVHDELSIHLPENPSTGYLWTFDDPSIPATAAAHLDAGAEPGGPPAGAEAGEAGHTSVAAPLALLCNEFEQETSLEGPARFGSSGERYLRLRVLHPGRYMLRLFKRRSWEAAAPPAEAFEVVLNVIPKSHGLSPQQQLLLAA